MRSNCRLERESTIDPTNESELAVDIGEFVSELLAGYEVRTPPRPKVLHDPIWGTHAFLPHEVAIIDSPVFQRLRRIHQTGLSFYTFPSTTQSRFEHSLGAAIVATRMLEAIARRRPDKVNLDPLRGDLASVRVAALLHDCGHGFLSHASEQLYRHHPAIAQARARRSEFQDASASELLAWHIITSKPFDMLLSQINEMCGTSLRSQRLADLILGKTDDPRRFVAEIINGPFDVDRVDYIVRDSDYAGIRSGIDLDRFFHDVDIGELSDKLEHLILHSTHPIEQLLWTKVHLFARLYRHQKVLAADAVVQRIITTGRDTGQGFLGYSFATLSDYLRLTDWDILGAQPSAFDEPISSILASLRSRSLPKRAVEFSLRAMRRTSLRNRLALHQVGSQSGGTDTLRDEIYDQIPKARRPDIDPSSIYVVLPSHTPLREASQVHVQQRQGPAPTTLNEIFRIDEWVTTYAESHWRGYVYCNEPDREVVESATYRALTARGVRLDHSLTTRLIPSSASESVVVGTQVTPLREPALPTVQYAAAMAQQDNPLPLRGVHALVLLHLLRDLPPLLKEFRNLGLAIDHTWIVYKGYTYPDCASVLALLRDRDKYQHLHGDDKESDVTIYVEQALTAFERAIGDNESFFVIEDGGHITSALHSTRWNNLIARYIGSVEQTTKGERRVRGLALLRPVVSIANSLLKTYVEGPEVGKAVVRALQTYLHGELDLSLHRMSVLVIGYGKIGKHVVKLLDAHGAKVAVHDASFEAMLDLEGGTRHEAVRELTTLEPFELVVAATGETSVTADLLFTCKSNGLTSIASCSSDYVEIDLPGFDTRLLQDGIRPTKGTHDLRYELTSGARINVLCGGAPINFELGGGITKSAVDPIYAEMLWGARLLWERKLTVPQIHPMPVSIEEVLHTQYKSLTGHV